MSLDKWRSWAGWVIVGGVVLASAISFALSYRGLWDWADHHDYAGWQWAFPLSIDTFIIVGEAVLFWAIVAHWPWRERVPAWCAVVLGLAASVAGNVGHVGWAADVTTRASAAVPPLAATGILALGLSVLKRVAAAKPAPLAPEAAPAPSSGKAAPLAAAPPAETTRKKTTAVKAKRIDLEAARLKAQDFEADCPHAHIPPGEGRVPVALEHFRACLDREPSENPMAAWTGISRSTLRRRLNGQLSGAGVKET